MAMGADVTFVAVGLDSVRHASAISAACGVAEALVVSVPFEPGSTGHAAIDDAINACLDKRPALPILSTDNDNYHNGRLVAFVGPQSYDVGVQCARALLFTTPRDMGDADGLDIILGRVPPPDAVRPSFYREYPGGVVPVYVAPGQEGNDALGRRFSAINWTLTAHGATARLTTERGARRTVLLSGAWSASFLATRQFVCGDEVMGVDAPQVGFSPFGMGLNAVSIASARAMAPRWLMTTGNSGANIQTSVVTSTISETSVYVAYSQGRVYQPRALDNISYGQTVWLQTDHRDNRWITAERDSGEKVYSLNQANKPRGNNNDKYQWGVRSDWSERGDADPKAGQCVKYGDTVYLHNAHYGHRCLHLRSDRKWTRLYKSCAESPTASNQWSVRSTPSGTPANEYRSQECVSYDDRVFLQSRTSGDPRWLTGGRNGGDDVCLPMASENMGGLSYGITETAAATLLYPAVSATVVKSTPYLEQRYYIARNVSWHGRILPKLQNSWK